MRRTLALALAVPLLGSLFACTAILGSFTVGDTGGGKDGSADGLTPDGNGDAQPDGPPAPGPMACDVNGLPQTIVNDPAFLQDRIWVHALPGGQRRYRVLVMRGQTNVLAYTVDDKFNIVGGAPVAVNSFVSTFNIRGVASYDGGFIVLAIVDKGAGPRLDAQRFDDGADLPDTNTFTVISTLSPDVNNDSQFALAPIDDLGTHEFFLAFTYKSSTTTWQLDTHKVTMVSSAGALATEPMTTVLNGRPGEFSMLLAKAARTAFIMLTGDQGKGDLQVFQTDFNGTLQAGPTVMKPQAGGVFIPLLGMPATGPADLSVIAAIQGDPGNTQIPLGIRSGGFTGAQLMAAKADLNTLPPLATLKVDEIAVDKGTALWQFFPVQGPQYTSAARSTSTGKGVNLNWYDGAGHLRGLRAGATALFPTEIVSTAASAVDGPPSPLTSDLVVTWINSNSDLRIARIGCLAK